MKKVFLIGGSPMTGKSTVAMFLSSQLNFAYMSTDDIGEVIQTVLPINPMQGLNYLDYYNINSVNKLIDDTLQYHSKLKNPINRLIDIHSTWGNPLIIEGWAIYPENVTSYSTNDVARIWIIATEGLLKKRLHASEGFYGASNQAIENYLVRSIWHNDLILSQCKKYNEFFLNIDEYVEKDTLIQRINTILLL